MNKKELIKAIANNKDLIWNDPDPIKGNNYQISYIEPITEEIDNYSPILIQYNSGQSEAQVFLHEILLK